MLESPTEPDRFYIRYMYSGLSPRHQPETCHSRILIETTLRRRSRALEMATTQVSADVRPTRLYVRGRVVYKSVQTEEPGNVTKFKKKLLTHFGTSCRELRVFNSILNHPPVILPVFSVTRARAATRHAMAADDADGRLMGDIFRWGRRASDDGALLICTNQAVIPKHSLCAASKHEQELELGEASRTPARARSSPRRPSELLLLLVLWCGAQCPVSDGRAKRCVFDVNVTSSLQQRGSEKSATPSGHLPTLLVTSARGQCVSTRKRWRRR